MILKHICVGKTQSYSVQGRNVKTAYVKEAQNGPVKMTERGPEGNETAVHTDAVYAFSEENYQFWAEHLNTDRQSWSPGYFAENLTISGLQEAELCVGDVVAIGDEVQLVVSGPRVPCLKLCWRMQQPESFIREFALSGKSGVYFNVLKTGTVSPGDEVSIVHRASEGVPIVELSQIVFGAKSVEVERLKHILNLDCLSETSKLLLSNQYYQLLDTSRTAQERWSEWRDFKVSQILEETEQVKSFTLTAADSKPVAAYRAGQFLTVKLPVEDPSRPGQSLVRVWSLSDYDEEVPQHYRLSIKKEPYGKGSGFMHEQLKVGDVLPVAAPMGRFVLDRGSFKPVLLLAGGIGITPLLAMLKAHLAKGKNPSPVYLIHCCQKRALQPLRHELDALASHEKASVMHVYDQPDETDELGVDYDVKGFLSIEHIQELISDCHIVHGGKRLDMPLSEFDIYMCGPPIFQEKMQEALGGAGANTSRIFQESFQGGSGDSVGGGTQRSSVSFTREGSDDTVLASWSIDDNLSLLELAESVGLKPASACKIGVCQSCSANLVQGEVFYEQSLTHSPEEGQILLCRARPDTEQVIIRLPA